MTVSFKLLNWIDGTSSKQGYTIQKKVPLTFEFIFLIKKVIF